MRGLFKIKIKRATVITFLLIAGGAFFFWNRSANFGDKTQNTETQNTNQTKDTETQNTNQIFGENSKTYTNQKYGFSFEYPEEMNVAEFQEGAGDIVLAQGAKTQFPISNSQFPNNNAGFQIFIIPFDEEGPLTPERIKQDLPEMMIDEPQNAIIGKDDIRALIFFGKEPGMERTREVWFIHNGFLYQVFAPAELDEFLGKVMESWNFQ